MEPMQQRNGDVSRARTFDSCAAGKQKKNKVAEKGGNEFVAGNGVLKKIIIFKFINFVDIY